MKAFFIGLGIFILAEYSIKAQEVMNIVASVSGGSFNSPYYNNAQSQGYYTVDFDLFIKNKHLISVEYLFGKHRYFDPEYSTTPGIAHSDYTNSDITYSIFSVLYKYEILKKGPLHLYPGAGVGILTFIQTFPLTIGNGTSYYKYAWSDLVFPVDLNVKYEVSPRWLLGLKAGFLIHPDYPILGIHFGPKLSFVIR